jgi:glycosyltransferase involved in cell wall biosynthesis
MKIVLIGRYGEGDIIAGPERVAKELYLHLKKKNIDVTFIEYFFSGYSDYSLINKILGSKITDDGILRLGIVPLILKLLREQFNVIHFINSQRFTLVVFFLRHFLKGKFISTLHGFYKEEIKIHKPKRYYFDLLVERLSIRKSDTLIFPSKLLFDLFLGNYIISEYKYRIIPNGVSEDFYNRKFNKDFGNQFNFVYYNSFNTGIEELLSSLTINFSIKLFIIGKAKEIENKNKIDIAFVSPMDKNTLINFLSDKHFIIKSSAFDSFSIFTAECMSMGIIPIVSENTGIKNFIEDGVNGFVCESPVSNNLERLLSDIKKDKYDLNSISRNATKIYEELNWDKITQQYISLYQSFND